MPLWMACCMLSSFCEVLSRLLSGCVLLISFMMVLLIFSVWFSYLNRVSDFLVVGRILVGGVLKMI